MYTKVYTSVHKNKSVHMQCSAVMELVVDGNVTPESDVVVTRKRERSDDKCEDVKKLQKEAEVKEEMRYEILFCYFPRWKIILPQG